MLHLKCQLAEDLENQQKRKSEKWRQKKFKI